MKHGDKELDNRVQDINLPELKLLIDDMLAELWTQCSEKRHAFKMRWASITTPNIPADEPVFLLRGCKPESTLALSPYIKYLATTGASDPELQAARRQGLAMAQWAKAMGRELAMSLQPTHMHIIG